VNARALFLAAVAIAGGTLAHAEIQTVTWAPSSTRGTTGHGTLDGITVTYFTTEAAQTGETLNLGWNLVLAPLGPFTDQSGIELGTNPAATPALQTITFSSPIMDPILLFAFANNSSSLNFGTLPITFLDSFDAQLSGDIVTFPPSFAPGFDLFAARIGGTFGPAKDLTFTYSDAVSATQVGFSVGRQVPSVPEPSLGLLSAALLLIVLTRGRLLRT
jgi:hypothetical protein